MTLHIQEDAPVFTADVKKIGSVKRVVIDPLTKQATHIVVKKGILFPQDRVVPIAAIETAAEHKIALHPECDVGQFPSFEEELDVRESETESGTDHMPFDRYGLYGLPFPAVPSVTAKDKERNIPDRSVPLKTGAAVISGGEKIGVFEEVLTQETGLTTHLVVVLVGTLDPKRKAIPMGWVRSFAEDSIHLGVPMGMVSQLPEHDPRQSPIS